jgi:Rv2525c-like, glycoside hydrolase-like domain
VALAGAVALLVSLLLGASGAMALAGGADKVVRYRRYAMAVPTSWPVYDLRAHPGVCVRFDRHAVYLGQPSSAQRCPAHAAGRTEAILLQPLAARGARARDAVAPALAPVTSPDAQPPRGSSTQQAIARAGVIVTATWGNHPAIVSRALGKRLAPATRADVAPQPAGRSAQARAAAVIPGAAYTGLGFDACSAPSAARMSAWSVSPYRAVGIYIGGANMACAQPNLTAGWVSEQSAAGWHLIPTYVGLQAPHNSCGCAAISPGRASVEGAAAASDAVSQAAAVGIGPGNPIYFDMESYARGGGNSAAVLTFLAAWTSSLHAAGYKSGVYSSAGSGISDLRSQYGTSFTEPDDIWIGEWNGQRTTASAYVPSGDWSNHRRLHQYDGGHNETHGGATINIDGNFLDGATAGASAAGASAVIPDGTFVQVAGSQAIYEIAGGAPLYVSPQYWETLSAQPPTAISQQLFALLKPVPADGTMLEDSTGAVYRVAGGAPLLVSDPSLFSAQPVRIDQWDIANAGTPTAHLNRVPANGTFLTTTTGGLYRVAGGAPFAISSWAVFGGVRPSVSVDQWDLANLSSPAAHLNAKPLDGTAVEGLPSRSYWVFAGARRRLTSASLATVQIDDMGLAAYRAIPCVVPRLRRLMLRQVRRALRRADCRLGRVQLGRPAAHSRSLRVIKQIPGARTRHAAAYQVRVTLG